MKTRCGYVAVIGKPNAGKSAFLNQIVDQDLALVSHKANATRKKMYFIIPYQDEEAYSQIIFVDTPGLHYREKLFNKFMLKEALRAHEDSDLVLFFTTPQDALRSYEEFLAQDFSAMMDRIKSDSLQEQSPAKPEQKSPAKPAPKPHIILLNKIDLISQSELLSLLAQFQKYQDQFLAIIPFSVKKQTDCRDLLKTIHRHLPQQAHLYDMENLTTATLKEICGELILESVFENLSDEIPYESSVVIEKFKQQGNMIEIFAKIFVQKESQKAMVIGRQAATIKRIGKQAREKIQKLEQKKVFLRLNVFVEKWSKDRDVLRKFGYNFDL